jgi:hypothetical protein
MKTLALIAIVFVSALTGNAYAQEWSINASSCVPDNTAIQANRYLNTAGSTKFQSAATGTITLYCPIAFSGNLSSPGTLEILYADDDNTAGNNVAAQYIKMNKTTGTLTTIVTTDTDQSSPPASTFCTQSLGPNICRNTFTDTVSTSTNFYYVRIDISRNSTSANEILFGVRLY